MIKFFGSAIKDELIDQLFNTVTFGDNVLLDWGIKLILGLIIYKILYEFVFNFVGEIYKTGIISGRNIGSFIYWSIMAIMLIFSICLTYLITLLIQNIKIIIIVITISLFILWLFSLIKKHV